MSRKPVSPFYADAENALAQIHELLDGTEWSADTTSAIADVITAAGLYVRDPSEMWDDVRHAGAGAEEMLP